VGVSKDDFRANSELRYVRKQLPSASKAITLRQPVLAKLRVLNLTITKPYFDKAKAAFRMAKAGFIVSFRCPVFRNSD
jgi:hypothetical protein